MSLITPLNRVLGLGSAKDGAQHWWWQRLTAVALLPLGLWLACSFLGLDDFAYSTVAQWMRAPLNGVLLTLTLLALTYHSQLGVQVVIEDYVHAEGLKTFSLIVATLMHIAVAVTGVFAVLRVGFGVSG